jgi:hypothetical protein
MFPSYVERGAHDIGIFCMTPAARGPDGGDGEASGRDKTGAGRRRAAGLCRYGTLELARMFAE